VSREFLLAEREKAAVGSYTEDCRTGKCTGCGVCDFDRIRMRLNGPGDGAALGRAMCRTPEDVGVTERVRLRFSKTGSMSLLSHLELINLFTRAIGRARVPIRFSQGFHPHPKFSFATALSVGVESWAEYFDMEIAAGFGADRVLTALNAALPPGLQILDAVEIPLRAASLSVIIDKIRYRVTLPGHVSIDLAKCTTRFLALETFPCQREKKGRVTELDLRQELRGLTTAGNALEMLVERGKPLEFVAAITGLSAAELAGARIEKLEVIFKA
jgi:radical SAM-linked protein